jgi:hypothetical protein
MHRLRDRPGVLVGEMTVPAMNSLCGHGGIYSTSWANISQFLTGPDMCAAAVVSRATAVGTADGGGTSAGAGDLPQHSRNLT